MYFRQSNVCTSIIMIREAECGMYIFLSPVGADHLQSTARTDGRELGRDKPLLCGGLYDIQVYIW